MAAYESTFSFDSILIVESLRPEDRRTGFDLHASTLKPLAQRESLRAEIRVVSSVSEFRAALYHAAEYTRMGHTPILHLEMHGSKEGLELSNGEIMLWKELAPSLTEINIASRMNLVVVAAACHGWHLSDALRPTSQAPAWAVIGPPDSVSAGSVFDAMTEFYSRLIVGADLMPALYAMNGGAEIKDWVYRFQFADYLFCQVFQTYLETVSVGESPTERVNRLVEEYARLKSADLRDTMAFRQLATAQLNDHEYWYNRYKERFLMLDLYPENRPRFKLGSGDCGKKASVSSGELLLQTG